jgi:regulator of replication initiation timing
VILLEANTWDTIIGTGGWLGAIGVFAYIGKQIFDSWLAARQRRKDEETQDRTSDQSEVGAAVGNMSSVNATLTKSIETLAAENDRLQRRNIHLESQVGERDQTIENLKSQLQELIERAQALAGEVTTYQLRLREQDHTVD